MTRRRSTTLVSLLVMIGIMLGLGACASGSGGGGASADATPTPVPTSVVPSNPTYVVQRGDVIRLLQFSGRVAPVLEEELFFKTSGYVDEVYIRRNDEVQEGDLLAELEVTDLKNQITQKEAELQSVQMDYERRVTEATNSVRAAEINLAKLEASTSESSIISARINLERSRIRLTEARDEYNKSLDRDWDKEEVRDRYAEAVRDAQWSVEISEAQYADAQKAQQRNGYELELSQMNLDLAKLSMAEIQTGLDVTRTVLALDRLTDQLNDARIVAPFTGVVLQSSIMEGKQVQGYSAMMVLADPSELDVSADLQDTEMSELAEGISVVAEFVNRPGEEYAGVIRRLPYPYSGGGLSEVVDDEDQSTRITLEGIDPVEAGWVIGDRLRLTSELERSEGTLWLPPQAVRTFEGRSFVVIQEASAQRRIDVRVGIRSDDRVEILDGLAEGQVIIAP
ncbi:MAG: efflux RND transporter periplasmic adaptor subunit [Anaerolineae bacterium]|nr:efflux RND transporter periplasmic adaptor subunit [Anaerolineae bacterium]